MKKIISALLIATMIVSMVCVSVSAGGIHINMNSATITMESLSSNFHVGKFYVDAGATTISGYSDARALQSYHTTNDDLGIFNDEAFVWEQYDTSVTFTMEDDELSDVARYIELIYCNDNLKYEGYEENRVYMSFMYDVEAKCFRLSADKDNTDGSKQYVAPVSKEIPADASASVTLGISVEKDRMRCFYNNEQIFDLQDPSLLIGYDIPSCFLLWNTGNHLEISEILVADPGVLYPHNMGGDPTPTDTTAAGNNNGAQGTQATSETTTATSIVEVTDEKGEVVTDEKGEAVTSVAIITEAAPAATNTGRPAGGTSTSTGDMSFVVVAVMVATLGCAIVVKKVSVK